MHLAILTFLTLLTSLTTAFNITTLRTTTPLNPSTDTACNTTITFTVHDIDTYNASVTPARTAQTTCTASWPALNGTPPAGFQRCADPSFGWMFGDEEGDIEGFVNVREFGFEVTHGWDEPGQGYLEEFGWAVANASSLTCRDTQVERVCHLTDGKQLVVPIYAETL